MNRLHFTSSLLAQALPTPKTFALACFACLFPLWSASSAWAQSYSPRLDQAEFTYQYRSCTVTTDVPIYKEGRDTVCGVESTSRYSESSCPVERYVSCEHQTHGIASWEDATGSPGKYQDLRKDGKGSVDACLADGEGWVARANANGFRRGRAVVADRPESGTRYFLIEVEWEAEDTRAFGRRVKANHRCTYTFGIERAQYADRRSAACGVESHQACRTRTTYNLCRDKSFGIESYKDVTGRHLSCGLRLQKGYVAVTYSGEPLAGLSNGGDFDVDRKIQANCPAISDPIDRHLCMRINRVALTFAEPKGTAYAEAVMASLGTALDKSADQVLLQALSTGDMRLQFDRMWDTYRAERNVGGADGTQAFLTLIDAAVPRIPDETYFPLTIRLATQALTAPALAKKEEDSIVYYAPLYKIISADGLRQRRVPFKTISDLLVLLRAADPTASPRMRGQVLILNEYLARLTSAYMDRRAYDIVQLQADAAQVRRNAMNVNAAIALVVQRVREMKLRPAVEASAIQQLQSANATAQLQTTIRDLIQAAKSDVTSTIASTARYMQESAERDKILRVNMANVHLIQGNINHAVHQMRESGVTLHQLPKHEAERSMLHRTVGILRSNLASAVQSSLKQSKAVIDKLRSGSELSLDVLGITTSQTSLPFGLVDALMQANVAVGDNLDGVRLQLINQIAANIVEPLGEAEAQLRQ